MKFVCSCGVVFENLTTRCINVPFFTDINRHYGMGHSIKRMPDNTKPKLPEESPIETIHVGCGKNNWFVSKIEAWFDRLGANKHE